MTTEPKVRRQAFWRTRRGRCYHRDRQCGYLQRARNGRTPEVRFLATDPGLGQPMQAGGVTLLTACPRCGT